MAEQKIESFFGHTEGSQKEALERLKSFLSMKDADQIYENVMYLERLQYMTLDMKRELLRKYDHDILAMAFKFSSTALIKSFLGDLSDRLKQEILHGLQRKSTIGEFQKKLEDLSTFVKKQESKGAFVLDKDSHEVYV